MLSKTSTHALKAMKIISELPDGQYIGVSQIAEIINAPKNYLGKLLQNLSNHGLLISQKGLNGGFRLSKNPEDVRLIDVVNVIEKTGERRECIIEGNKLCNDSKVCALHHAWKKVETSYIEFLSTNTIKNLTFSALYKRANK